MPNKKVKVPPGQRSPRRVDGFCAAVGISRRTFYDLPVSMQPKSVKLGAATIITESPEEFLQRISAMQMQGARR